ncbi:MAG: hypothetical protein ACP5NV_06815 [Candidatus Woesearchaeota archaeon]
MDIYEFANSIGLDIKSLDIVTIGKNTYLAGKDLQETRSRIKRDVFSIGIFLGEEGKYFMPSPAFIELLSKMPDAEKKKIYVSSKVEGLFLYGRNILKDSISKNPHNIDSGYVFVQNENDENLGLGIFQTQTQHNSQKKELIIKNILDKGFYLRKERR